MDEKIAKNYLRAGKILQDAQKKARKQLKVGEKMLTLAENVEKEIASLGGAAAFPINLSVNEEAAHYTPSANDEKVFEEKDVVKVDIGVHVDGYIADAAFTVDLSGEFGKMVKASEDALEAAVKVVKEDAEIGEIGKVIHNLVAKNGFRPVQNLSGHGLERWDAHAAPTIPNIDKLDDRVLEEGMVIAVEPFVTDGEGYVKESSQSEIFQLQEARPVRSREARQILELVQEKYKTLPFAERWVDRELGLSDFRRKLAMRELMQKGCLHAFPVLKEAEGKTVTQSETSIMLHKGKAVRLV